MKTRIWIHLFPTVKYEQSPQQSQVERSGDPEVLGSGSFVRKELHAIHEQHRPDILEHQRAVPQPVQERMDSRWPSQQKQEIDAQADKTSKNN